MLTTIDDKNLYDIADAIREVKGETAKYKPNEMAGAIGEIVAVPDDALYLTGNLQNRFAYGGTNWLIESAGDKIVSKDITNMSGMFKENQTIRNIPFELNCKAGAEIDCKELFYRCYGLREVPKINNCKILYSSYMFYYCKNLRYLPEDIESWFDWSRLEGVYYASRNNMFDYCQSLRSIPMGFLAHNNGTLSSSSCFFYGGFNGCSCLDELVDIPISWHTGSWTSNAFYQTFNMCQRLQRVTFETQEDGTPYTMKWKSQTIDLSKYVGYAVGTSDITSHNSGITHSNRVTGASDYPTLSQSPDWFTTLVEYSRYNHDSAVETINSLPDTSAYGTNTIKFKGASGSATTGGAINTLTAEEIAVAAAKGWTVSLV